MQTPALIDSRREDNRSGRRPHLLSVILVLIFIGESVIFAPAVFGKEPLSVRVGAYQNPPKIFLDQKGGVSGFWPDLMEHIAKTENWKIEYVRGTWRDGLERLKNKEIDIMPDVAFTEKRGKRYAFSEAPVLASWTRVYVNKKNTQIQSITDLKNKKIAALKGSVNLEGPGGLRELCVGFHLNCTFLELDDYEEVFQAVEEGRADAGITNTNFGNKHARDFQVEMTPIVFQPVDMKFAFPKDAEQTPFFVKRINDRMKNLKQDDNSPYYRLLKKHFEGEIAEEEIPVWFKTVWESLGFIFILFILVIIISRIQVRRRTRDIRIKNEALRKSEARLRNVFEASPLGIGLFKNRVMQWQNNALARMSGYSLDEFQGKNTRSLYANDAEFERVGKAINTLGGKNRTVEIETRLVRRDGMVFDCHIRYALMDTESEDGLVLAMAEDITERKKAEKEKREIEAQLNQAQKMETVGVLAGGVAHDFNNILTTIIGNADLALMDLDKNSSFYDNVDEIRKAGHRGAGLTRQLLAFSRKELIRPEVLDINSLLMNFGKMLHRLIREDIDLVTACAPDLWHVEADPGQMEQVIMNLVVNAGDAMPKGGILVIETANVELDETYFRDKRVEGEPGPYVMLAVTDSGMGMDKETQAHIFEPFFTTKGLGRGTGLGLATVYGIVKQNRGLVWVYSEEGKGTTFKVYFPRVEGDGKRVVKERASTRSLEGSETILVVEDDDSLRNMARQMLEGYRYRVITAENGREAIKLSESHDGDIHLLLTDVVMPGMTGPDLAEQVKSRWPEIKVVYMSGYTADIIGRHGVLEKNVAFIQKPFNREGLAAKVREVLNKEQD